MSVEAETIENDILMMADVIRDMPLEEAVQYIYEAFLAAIWAIGTVLSRKDSQLSPFNKLSLKVTAYNIRQLAISWVKLTERKEVAI